MGIQRPKYIKYVVVKAVVDLGRAWTFFKKRDKLNNYETRHQLLTLLECDKDFFPLRKRIPFSSRKAAVICCSRLVMLGEIVKWVELKNNHLIPALTKHISTTRDTMAAQAVRSETAQIGSPVAFLSILGLLLG